MSTLLAMLLPALLVSGASALALALSSGGPARLRLAIAVVGLLSWIVPWPLIVVSFPIPEIPLAMSWIAPGDATAVLDTAARVAPTSGEASVGFNVSLVVLMLLLTPGLVMFLIDVVRYRETLSGWRREAADGEELRALLPHALRAVPHEIRLLPAQNIAAATGLMRGTIWIGRGLAGHAHLRSALVHECVHVARRDVVLLTLIAFISRIWFWNPIVRYFARQARFLIEVVCDEVSGGFVGRTQYRDSLATLILDAQGDRAMTFVPTIITGRQDVARVVELGSAPRMHARAWIGLIFCTLGIAGATVLNAQSGLDPRIGVWDEQRSSSAFQSLRRSFETLPNGMTRMVLNAKLEAVNRQHVDYYCDGKPYPMLSASNIPTGVVYSCRRTGDREVESSLEFNGTSGATGSSVAPTVTSTRVIEAVSGDGKTLTMRIQSHTAQGGIRESHRDFVRRQP